MIAQDLTRRGFLAAGTGLFVFAGTALEAQQAEPAQLPQRVGYPSDFNAYLRIGADGRVTCFVGKVELGQGAETTLAQCLAQELAVPYESIDMVMGDTDLCPYDMGTFGSMCAPFFTPVLRAAGAEAKAVLLALAAERLGAPAERLVAKDGAITDPQQSKRVTYAELVAGKRIERHIPKVPVTAPAAMTVLRHSPVRKDALAKVTGKARYAADYRPAGMLCARLLTPPAHGAKLKSLDTSAAEKAGARVVRTGDLIAILHEHRDLATRALGMVKAEWDRPRTGVDDRTIYEHLRKLGPPMQTVGQNGSLAEGEKLAAQPVEETYRNAYVAHSAMEPHSAVARFENGKVTVWASTQAPYAVKPAVAQALGLPAGNVRIIAAYVGGGFGGKSDAEQGVAAARLSKAIGRPVQVVYDRDEEFYYDTFRPAAVVKIRSGLTSAGRVAFWDFQVWGGGDREAETYYDIPHRRTQFSGNWMGTNPEGMHPFGVGAWRAPSVNTNTFARESHMDILALKAGADPLQFRMNHLSDARMKSVLQAAAAKFGWKPAQAPSRRGIGIACGIYSGTRVASCAEVEVNRSTGAIQVKRIVTAIDQGLTLNPDGMRQQTEGAITMGLGYALTEEVHFRDGELLDRNFDTYTIPRFSWLPKMEVVLVENTALPAGGGGEPPIITMGAVIANAVFDATGARPLELPMTPERIQALLRG